MPSLNFDIESLPVVTPAFVYDEGSLLTILTRLQAIASESWCKVLFSLKAFALIETLRLMVPMLDGFAASSLFEARLARDVLADKGSVHITTPSLTSDEVDELGEFCDYISFNSLSQWNRFSERASKRISCGLRINPQLSFVKDDRYNPCRSHSKLGVPLDPLVENFANGSRRFRQLRGLHFHTNCDSLSLEPLLATINIVDLRLGNVLESLEWINLGGGYQYSEISVLEPFYEGVSLLKRRYGLEVFVEPGETVVGSIGYMVSSVVDLFESEGKTIAILDTSINHIPSVFTYQCRLAVLTEDVSGKYAYLLAGATCLAGDLFGEYRFNVPLEIGSKVTFEFVGAYSLVKANMFNGINLPSIYAVNQKKELLLKKRYTIKDFISCWNSP